MAWSEDVPARFDAYGWHTQRVENGNDIAAIEAALDAAQEDERPSLIAVRTHIGYGSPNSRTRRRRTASPLGDDEVRLTKEAYGWDPDRQFYVPDEVREHFERFAAQGQSAHRRLGATRRELPGGLRRAGRRARSTDRGPAAGGLGRRAQDLRRRGRDRDAQREPGGDPGARGAGAGAVRRFRGPFRVKPDGRQGWRRPQCRRGRAGTSDSVSASTAWAGSSTASPTTAASSRTRATFLNFSDYMRGSVRLAALADLHVVYVWTHDSVGLGEDGPTHQPVEHYAALRAMPNLWFVRPGDANETAAAWALAASRRGGPVALSLTRQKLPTLEGTAEKARDGRRPGRLRPAAMRPVARARGDPHRHRLGAPARRRRRGRARGGRHPGPRRLAARAGRPSRPRTRRTGTKSCRPTFVGASRSRPVCRSAGSATRATKARSSGIDHFGASAPAGTIFEKFGFTADRVADVAGGSFATGCAARPDARSGPPAGRPRSGVGAKGGATRRSTGRSAWTGPRSDPGHS